MRRRPLKHKFRLPRTNTASHPALLRYSEHQYQTLHLPDTSKERGIIPKAQEAFAAPSTSRHSRAVPWAGTEPEFSLTSKDKPLFRSPSTLIVSGLTGAQLESRTFGCADTAAPGGSLSRRAALGNKTDPDTKSTD